MADNKKLISKGRYYSIYRINHDKHSGKHMYGVYENGYNTPETICNSLRQARHMALEYHKMAMELPPWDRE
jgi:hypothetical protein